ncbi:nucleotidyl transferase AbiEii/AbiGii toxin family protein [Kocuria marina]|uniref:nucleotidyl transferase AbiEii/AbiGii toxin family protein n=1 Tax=Kocuria marina TaxID=223184 RepID=UPI0022E58FC9|nr:nucleotidyl transferase AbiEii/AbiGii toxin family protein [Kocuria marina]
MILVYAQDGYATPHAVKQAIKSAARKARGNTSGPSIDALIRQEYFNRFLSRVFSERQSSRWVLKGGTAMLARIPDTRATLDIDLLANSSDLEEAEKDLARLAAVDLGDHFRFVHDRSRRIAAGEAQDYTDGLRVTFIVYIGPQRQADLSVDLVTGTRAVGPIETIIPANRLDLPRLHSSPYRLYPIAHQLADKVCAVMMTYNGVPSTREKDLVDLAVAATSAELRIEAHTFGEALHLERRRRRIQPFEHFTVPPTWGPQYAPMARKLPALENYRDVEQAVELMHLFIDPILTMNASGQWSPHERRWI